jgi:hypothetical protein
VLEIILKKLTIKLLLINLSLSFGSIGISYATTNESLQTNIMVERSHACVIAKAISSEGEIINGQTYTRTEFEVTEIAFGNVNETISLLTPGGGFRKGKLKISEVVPGVSSFTAGRDYFLFLKAKEDGSFILTDYGQSRFVVNDNIVSLPESLGGRTMTEQVIEQVTSLSTKQ